MREIKPHSSSAYYRNLNEVGSPAPSYSYSCIHPNLMGNYFCFQGWQRWKWESSSQMLMLCISPDLHKNWQQLRKPPLLQSHSQPCCSHPKVQRAPSCLINPSQTVNVLSLIWVHIHSMTGKQIHIYCFRHCRKNCPLPFPIAYHHIRRDSRVKEMGCWKVKKPKKMNIVHIFT